MGKMMNSETARRILIVDDEKGLLEMIKELFEKSGYQVETASDGQKALEIATHKDLDLIITDILMPVMDGYTLYKKLKETGKTSDVPVLVMTARPQMEDSFKALGVDDFVPKPCELEKLLSRVEYLITRRSKPRSRGKVLVVGEDQFVTNQIAQQLNDDFCDAHRAKDGIDLIGLAIKTKPDIILVDVLLQEISAKEIIRALRCFNRLRKTAIVAYTQFDPEELSDIDSLEQLKVSKNACMEAGADKYIGRFSRLSITDSLKEYLH